MNVVTTSVAPTGQHIVTTSAPDTGFVNPFGSAPASAPIAPSPVPGQATPPPAAPISAPPMSPIGNPVNPPTNSGTPAPINASAPTLADQFNTSISSTLSTQQQQLQDAYKSQQATYQKQIDDLNTKDTELQQLQDAGMLSEKSTIAQEAADKRAALDEYQKQFEENYSARVSLTGRLSTLLNNGQQIIEQIKGTSGLSSIMNARISETMANVQGEAGVISATLAAYDGNIGEAQSHLTTTLSAITSIYGDQISYWKNVIDFYSGQAKDNSAKIASLSNDQQKYIDAQLATLNEKVATTQATAKIIQDAMLDPTKALAYARAGVSLTDSPAQISQKLATYEQAQQNVWSAPKLVGGDYIQTNKLTGETRTSVSNVPTPPGTPAPGGPNYSKGTMSAKQYVELSLQRAGLQYEAALAKVPAGKVGVVDNASGQIGYIDPTEYNTKQYTYL